MGSVLGNAERPPNKVFLKFHERRFSISLMLKRVAMCGPFSFEPRP